MESRDRRKQEIQEKVQALVDEALEEGFVVSVDTKPLRPLAMGNYRVVVEVREARY